MACLGGQSGAGSRAPCPECSLSSSSSATSSSLPAPSPPPPSSPNTAASVVFPWSAFFRKAWMALAKWITTFGTASSSATPSAPPPEELVPILATADAKQFGLENFGNTCYANSVLQALYFCGPFRELLVQYPDPSVPEVPLPPPVIPLPAPPPPPQATTRPKPVRKGSISETFGFPTPSHAPTSPSPSRPTPPSVPIPPAPPTLLSALRSLYLHISRNPADKGTVAPKAFIDKLKELNELFRSTMHQDAHEFLNYLLNQIVEEMDEDRKKLQNGNGSPNGMPGEDLSASIGTLSSAGALPTLAKNTLVHQLFEGILTSETRCLTCETVSSRDESFLDLSIDIEQNSSVTACLRQFSASEMLCQRNKFFCDSCCDLQEAEKRMKIKKLPNILALHLKRFKYQEDVGKYIKLAYRVAFPLELRLFNTVDDAQNPDRLYELFAIVVHIGNGPHHGHYVSVIKARGAWYLFDDDTVETVKESDIPKYFGESNAGSAYVLYYQAADLDKSALGLHPPESVTQSVASPLDSSASQSGTLATTFESEELSPALPPGLTPQASEDSTPLSQPSLPSPPGPLSPQPTSQPPLSLDTSISSSSKDTMTASPTATATPNSSERKGIFGSLRTSPSMSLRRRPGSSHGAPDHRTSVVEPPPPVPPLPATSSRHLARSEIPALYAIPSSPAPMPAPMSPLINGKEKEKDKNSGNWFKRKSRTEKPMPPSASGYLAERSVSMHSGELDDGATPWYRSKRVSRRASEVGLAFSSTSTPVTPVSATAPAALHELGTVQEQRAPAGDRSEKHAGRQRPSTASGLERPPSMIAASLPPMPTVAPPPHPSTAHPATHSPHANGHALAHSALPARKGHRPHTAHAASVGYAPSANGTTSTLSESTGSSSAGTGGAKGAKRATRKLSFTAPMLGFGRRERDKEKERPQTPTGRR
ncbi:hypothetical protein PHLGIDRAFT_128834 [Phlebiopsis gigantea 11061_1 CR5-6]|uniref:Ubiquitin carboxyl-terminal hydrolase n=1 Tax=Phlebiopsis gigantea (strain 11061_1 CR5-6) TaxID=745531 RepID=A0A0C3S8P8_PHLG1|nr:hypothetical protein PHLGIDRAFT_128834 [Phlebiopsis gigantea 11061_1 CR5-6]